VLHTIINYRYEYTFYGWSAYSIFFIGRVKVMNELQTKVRDFIGGVKPVDSEAGRLAREYIDGLVKPPGSLGKMEEIAVKIAGITGNTKNTMDKKCIIVLCSDNGVVEEGVASAPKSVTLMQSLNFTKGITGVCVFARQAKADVIVVDVGIDADIDDELVINRKIRRSTSNIARGPAMTYDEACKAVLAGIEMVELAISRGYQVIGTGEMGIGNTTTSGAILTALTGLPASLTIGKGAGASLETWEKKKNTVIKAIELNRPDLSDPLDVLAKLGGFDIAAMVGVYLGAAYYRLPVVMDGFISATAAMIAIKLNENIKDYIIESHASAEPGFMEIMKEIRLEPMFNMGMRLGEGSGCPLGFIAIDMACAMVREMATFAEAQIDEKYLEQLNSFEF